MGSSPVAIPPGFQVENIPKAAPALPPGFQVEKQLPSVPEQIGHSLMNQAKGMFDVISSLVGDPATNLAKGEAAFDAQTQQWEKAKSEYKAGNYGNALHRALAAFVPGVGPSLENAAEKLQTPGQRAEGATDILAPIVLGAAVKGAPKAVDAISSMVDRARGSTAQTLMKSALKPGVADAPTLESVRGAVNTALENKIPVTEAGATKLQSLIEDYGKKTQAVIDSRTRQGATVDPNAVASRLDQINTSQVLPEKDITTINKAKEAFLARKGAQQAQAPQPTGLLDAQGNPVMTPGAPARPAQPVPLDVAQAEKQGTYRQNAAKYGEMSQAQIEAEKALARGYKEELEAQAPELKLLNEKEGRFLDLQPALERAVRRAGNQDVASLKDIAAGAAGGLAAGPAGAALGLTARVFDYPGLKSKLAIAINKASQKTSQPLGISASTAKAATIIGLMTQGQGNVPSMPVGVKADNQQVSSVRP